MSQTEQLDVEVFEPTGEIEMTETGSELVIVREFPQSPAVVWEYITDSADIARWYGTWAKKEGSQSTYELTTWDKQEVLEVTVEEATKPELLRLKAHEAQGPEWEISFELSQESQGSVLVFRHTLDGIEDRSGYLGAKWEFKLDRLMIALAGGDVETVALENYYPYQAEHYALNAS